MHFSSNLTVSKMKRLFLVLLANCVCLSLSKFTKDLDEGGCVDFKRLVVDPGWLMRESMSGWYFPILSSQNANAWKRMLTGTPLESEDQLAGMCLRIFVNNNIIRVTGYGNKAVFNCTVQDHGHGKQECRATEESTFPEIATIAGESSMGISWADRKNYLVSVRCLKGRRIWALIATTPFVSEGVRHTVLEHISGLGFSPEKAVFLPYKSCKY